MPVGVPPRPRGRPPPPHQHLSPGRGSGPRLLPTSPPEPAPLADGRRQRDGVLASATRPAAPMRLALLAAAVLVLSACGESGPPASPPEGWVAADATRWYVPGADTTAAFRDLSTIEAMGVAPRRRRVRPLDAGADDGPLPDRARDRRLGVRRRVPRPRPGPASRAGTTRRRRRRCSTTSKRDFFTRYNASRYSPPETPLVMPDSLSGHVGPRRGPGLRRRREPAGRGPAHRGDRDGARPAVHAPRPGRLVQRRVGAPAGRPRRRGQHPDVGPRVERVRRVTLDVLPGRLAVCRLAPGAPLAGWMGEGRPVERDAHRGRAVGGLRRAGRAGGRPRRARLAGAPGCAGRSRSTWSACSPA